MDKEKIRLRISEEIEKTEKQVMAYRELCEPVAPDCAIGRVSRMDAINNKSVNEASLRKAEEKLSTLKVALGKVDDDDFGNCIRCGNKIPLGRILFRPESMHCVNCAGKL
ncbi:MAG: TraR/DksA family transcriptional regulator [Marinilabiliales bacterium]|nr:MAG: TraR/DksA family transcriptional regulator [Marinilabiliales bacterium]